MPDQVRHDGVTLFSCRVNNVKGRVNEVFRQFQEESMEIEGK
jgi:hypothetical protein